MDTCTIEGCDKPKRSGNSDWCAKHYHRWYRHGDPLATYQRMVTATPRTYVMRSCPGHPLANKAGRQYEHRIVLWDCIGPGVHACHWCETDVHWTPEPGQTALVVDHLDGIKHHNAPENLVPCCARCNTARAALLRHEVAIGKGAWQHHDTVGALGPRASKRPEFSAA